jgi:hypothetical protein
MIADFDTDFGLSVATAHCGSATKLGMWRVLGV